MLKFSESCFYFINHVDLPFSSLGLVFIAHRDFRRALHGH